MFCRDMSRRRYRRSPKALITGILEGTKIIISYEFRKM